MRPSFHSRSPHKGPAREFPLDREQTLFAEKKYISAGPLSGVSAATILRTRQRAAARSAERFKNCIPGSYAGGIFPFEEQRVSRSLLCGLSFFHVTSKNFNFRAAPRTTRQGPKKPIRFFFHANPPEGPCSVAHHFFMARTKVLSFAQL